MLTKIVQGKCTCSGECGNTSKIASLILDQNGITRTKIILLQLETKFSLLISDISLSSQLGKYKYLLKHVHILIFDKFKLLKKLNTINT